MDNNNIEYSPGALQKTSGVGAAVAPSRFNPEFVAQFDINIVLRFFRHTYTIVGPDVSYGTNNPVDPADLPQQFKTDLAFFLFGESDGNAKYENANKLTPVASYDYVENFVINTISDNYTLYVEEIEGIPVNPSFLTIPILSPRYGAAQRGDVIQLYSSPIATYPPGSLSSFAAEVIINCKQVGYGTLLSSSSSDRFQINNLRYKIPSADHTEQFEKQLRLVRQSLFGKLSTDEISPAAYLHPDQFQPTIVDIPLIKGVDKETSICSYIKYDVEEILISVFVDVKKKITA